MMGPPNVGLDATPSATNHSIRGIGRYVSGAVEALATRRDWLDRVGFLAVRRQRLPQGAVSWTTLRSPFRPQDVNPVVAAVADRLAVRGARLRIWHHTDPAVPFSPLPMSRTLITVYDLIPLRDPAVMAGMRAHRRLAYRRYLESIKAARGVIAISRTTADEVERELGVDTSRIRVVPPLVLAHRPAVRPIRPFEPPRFLAVGVPDPHKRVELAIEGVAEFVRRGTGARLDFVGVIPPSREMELHRIVRTAGLEEHVRFLGRIDDSTLYELYARSVLVATSSVEGFGLPPVEAILAGGSVVATPNAAYREALEDTATYSRDISASALADAMETALTDPPDPRARAHLAQRFGPEAVAGALVDAYKALGGIV